MSLSSARKSKFIYAIVGAAGTFFVNVIRITLIVVYATYVNSAYQLVDAFHNSIGEVLFMIWIFTYLLFVIRAEKSRNSPPRETARTPPQQGGVV